MNRELDKGVESESPLTDENESLLPIDEHEEIVSENGKKVLRRGIFLLPNLMTLGALFSGFYAIVAAMAGDFNEAGWALLIAGVFDALDGRIARLTNTQSAFGAQFDSLSDMVSFGVAPAFISFSWAFPDIGRLGWAASFIYMSCAAMRLARFNVQLGSVDKRYFVGLQSPMAAALVGFIPWVSFRHGVEVTSVVAYGMMFITLLAGMLMISNYKYHSFKEVYVKGTVPYLAFVAAVILLVVIAQEPPEVLLTLCIIYVASGPLGALWRRIKDKQSPDKGPS
jgi:CDP-diacylglycerol--serine O-phosphatidyltransferase